MVKDNVGLIVFQGDCLLQGKVTPILKRLIEEQFVILDFEIKQLFSEAEKEEFYLSNLNNGSNTWWFAKETFSLNDTIAILVTHKTNVYKLLSSIKGSSNPLYSNNNSIRKQFKALCLSYNLIHTSDSYEDMLREGKLYFSYNRLSHPQKKAINIKDIDRSIELIKFKSNSKTNIYKTFLYRIIIGARKKISNLDQKFFENDICQCSTSNLENKIVNELENVLRVHSYEMHSEDWYYLSLLKIKCDKLFQRNIDVFFWHNFWLILELNEISINEVYKNIITGLFVFKSI